MSLIESKKLTQPNVEVPQELASRLRDDCLGLLKKRGLPRREKKFGRLSRQIQDKVPLSPAVSFTHPVTTSKGKVNMEISANRPLGKNPEIVSLRAQRYHDELVLVREGDHIVVLILERWGMGETLDQIEQTIEHVPGGEVHHTNPRLASLGEAKPYERALNEILRSVTHPTHHEVEYIVK